MGKLLYAVQRSGVCQDCGNIINAYNLFKLFKNIGVRDEFIEEVKAEINALVLASAIKDE